MKILIATEVIHPGGAETFLLRLSQALHQKKHEVTVYNFYPDIYNKELHLKIAPDIKIVSPRLPFRKLVRLADRILGKLGTDRSIRNYFIKKDLKRLIEHKNPEIIHSHLFKTDLICCEAARQKNIPVISTMHGDYAMFYHLWEQNNKLPFPGFEKKLKYLLSHLTCFVCISGEQIDFFSGKMQSLVSRRLEFVKIYNGYNAPVTKDPLEINRETLKIPEDAFVFGMVARGIPSKGWEELIEAFLKLEKENAYLLLVGGSEYMDALKQKNRDNKQIIFAGTVTNPLEWIKVFDAGLLPSYFGSESLPTVVMEYLLCQKPVIATRIGEIPAMVEEEGNRAGILVDIVNNKTDVNQLEAAMHCLYSEKQIYRQLKENASVCFQKFDMRRCAETYEQTYRKYASGKER